MKNYKYKRALGEVSDTWHKVVLPTDIFGKVSAGLSDLRIYGITTSHDTLEAPYVLRVTDDVYTRQQVQFNLINTVHNSKGYYYTFEVPTSAGINHIELDFQGDNYDRYVNLEGSQDQKEWYVILKESRVLSIKNAQTHYTFNSLSFPVVQYQYLRLFIPENGTVPVLNSARLTEEVFNPGEYVTHNIQNTESTENNEKKQTEIMLDMGGVVPVAQIKIHVSDEFDFYRPVIVEYLYDSIKTPNGWKERYRTAYNGTLSSLENNELKFRSVFTDKVKITIHNFDNNPLHTDSFLVKGNVYELHARFTELATYVLAYGNDRSATPNYDIVNFTNNIPKDLPALAVGEEEIITKGPIDATGPLFVNKAWLWAVMGLIIFVLGWFSIHMIRK
ncbi:DUF3999 family protein [Fulvivirga ulvae]|uniref:DUF3999 family protein n=1 Tax=Fulvivirga ulvae TaxID=2904245 RepID=UPI001F1997FC|nr:DUF3999 family protein [Fulvivirga ulvae]UII30005.1 DUF3999 family protein [Fulvivirga ulvae]